MGKRIVINPIPRIEGHLGIEIEVEDGKVKNAWASGALFRGFEIILKNRDPRDAWLLTQRICGVCPTSHAHTSAMCIEDSYKIRPPDNARIIRNLVEGSQFLHSHILWFYHLTGLDYVDVVSALSAKPTEQYLKNVQAKIKTFVDSGQLGPFANAYWGHPAYKLPPDLNLLIVAHYLEALEMQSEASHLSAFFGGKMPMVQATPPGGVTCTPSVEDISNFLFRLKKIQAWVDNVFIPDVLLIAPYYLEYTQIGRGVGNYLAWGVFEDKSFDPNKRTLPMGAIYNWELKRNEVNHKDVTEHVKHSWYKDGPALNPAEGITEPDFTDYDTEKKYTWAKAPRMNDKPMECGALSRMLIAYVSGNETAKKLIDDTLNKLGVAGKHELLMSPLGRAAARALETKLIADAMVTWTMELIENLKTGKNEVYTPHKMPDAGIGAGLWEAPRGALGHWYSLKQGKVDRYQIITPTAWNISPRDEKGVRGPIEEALVGTPVVDAKRPVEVLRVVHSFDPCIACTVHIIDPETNEIRKFRVS